MLINEKEKEKKEYKIIKSFLLLLFQSTFNNQKANYLFSDRRLTEQGEVEGSTIVRNLPAFRQ